MQILILTDSYPPAVTGGAEVIADTYARQFARSGHTVTVVTSVQDAEQARQVRDGDIMIRRAYVPRYHPRWRAYVGIYNPSALRILRGILTELRPDVVHIHNVHQFWSLAAIAVAQRNGYPVVFHAHDTLGVHYGKFPGVTNGVYRSSWWRQARENGLWFNPFRNILARRLVMRADRIVAVSHALARILEAHGVTPVTVVHNGISLSWSHISQGASDSFRDRFDLTAKKVVLVSGRLTDDKGVGELPAIALQLRDHLTDMRIVVAGRQNNMTRYVQDEAKKTGTEEMFVFTGWLDREEVKAAYAVAHCVAVLSVYEDPFPTTNLEAMVFAQPVIGTPFGGTPEIVRDGVTGYIVNPRDTEQCSSRIRQIIENPQLRLHLGQAGRHYLEEHFTVERQAGKMLEIFKSLMSK